VRSEGIGFDDDYDRAAGGFDGVRFACVEYASHAGVDVGLDFWMARRNSDAAVND
jgi:hypothetical protein